jgi:hypothetical protein
LPPLPPPPQAPRKTTLHTKIIRQFMLYSP